MPHRLRRFAHCRGHGALRARMSGRRSAVASAGRWDWRRGEDGLDRNGEGRCGLPTSMAMACSYWARAIPRLIAADRALSSVFALRPAKSDRRLRCRSGLLRVYRFLVCVTVASRICCSASWPRISKKYSARLACQRGVRSQDRQRSIGRCIDWRGRCCAPYPTDPAPKKYWPKGNICDASADETVLPVPVQFQFRCLSSYRIRS